MVLSDIEWDDEFWGDDISETSQTEDVQLLDLDAISTLVDDMTFSLVSLDVPHWYINPSFSILFDARSSFDSIAACSPLTFPSNLHEVLTSSEPPSINFFKSLPLPDDKIWAIYVIVMEKDGCTPRLYIGSGTDAQYGVHNRLAHYKHGCSMAPRFVQQAFKEKCDVAHKGLLCWTPLPTAGLAPRVRARFLAVEALFTCLFHACHKAIADAYYNHLLLWGRATATWTPMCSHLLLNEKIVGDIHLSAEELEIVAAIQKHRRAKYLSDHRAAKKARDPDAFRAHDRIMKNAWAERNRDRVNTTAAKVRHTAISSDRFRCDVCAISLQSGFALDSHLLTQAHADRMAGIQKSELSQKAINTKTKRAAAKANNLNHCLVCERSFDTDWALTRHKEGKRHIAKEAKAS